MKFVIQKHATIRVHYDLRLEIGNELHSWSIPKGPTLDPSMKRLAMETTDHDLAYAEFEGIIPEGQSGAGKVMIWDTGTYIPEIEVEKGTLVRTEGTEESLKVMQGGLEQGMLKFSLFGSKIKGSFALVKTKGFGPKNSWLMIKHKDAYVKEGYDAADSDFSATTARTMEEIK
ncbi:MAG: DNA ligase [bacterium]|nr:DNA ligase [bacterium]